MGQFNLFKSEKSGNYYFNLTSDSNEVILASQSYTSKEAALKGIESVKKNALYDGKFQRVESDNGIYYFMLKASNGKTIGASQMYKSYYGRENGISAVKQNVMDAPIFDKKMAVQKYKNLSLLRYKKNKKQFIL